MYLFDEEDPIDDYLYDSEDVEDDFEEYPLEYDQDDLDDEYDPSVDDDSITDELDEEYLQEEGFIIEEHEDDVEDTALDLFDYEE